MSQELKVTVVLRCHTLPGTSFDGKTAVRLGIQCGQQVIEDVAGDAESAVFTVPLRVTRDAKTGLPNFLGPYAHGTPQQRFLYLNWGERKNGAWEGFRRAKIQLGYLGWDTVERAAKSGEPIQAELCMTDNKGGPLCASVKEDKIQWTLN